MKKFLALSIAVSATGAAFAQSSVTLFGIVDAGLTYSKASGSDAIYGMSNSGNLTSRIGFRGMEDLGGGLKAGFWLEGGFNNDSGAGLAGGAFDFKRRSTLSLIGGFGELRAGRAFTRAYEDLSRYDVFGQVGIGQNQTWYNAPVAVVRASNMLTYISPSLSGFKASLDYGFGEVAGKASQNRYVGGSLAYDSGPLSATVAAEQWSDAAYASGAQTVVLDNTRAYGVGLAYNWGSFKLSGLLRQQRNKAEDGSSVKFNTAHLGATVPMGTGEARVGYNYYDNNSADGKAHQLSLGYVHHLSKRTAVYGTYAFMKNQKQERFMLTAAGISLTAPAAGKNQNALTVGIRHSF
ncbi:porin [Comamonas sp. J-3]|uniref:porin n=1 Tax=Comamonas trifloxystrobinivorans TaxID=3350256 RepID=UPI003729D3C1